MSTARAPRMLSEAWDRAAVLLEADCDAEEEICYPVLSGAARRDTAAGGGKPGMVAGGNRGHYRIPGPFHS